MNILYCEDHSTSLGNNPLITQLKKLKIQLKLLEKTTIKKEEDNHNQKLKKVMIIHKIYFKYKYQYLFSPKFFVDSQQFIYLLYSMNNFHYSLQIVEKLHVFIN